MKDYKDADVLKLLKTTKRSWFTGKEHYEKYSCYNDYVFTDNKIYSADEINKLAEEEKNKILNIGHVMCESYLYSLMKYQHLIDNNQNIESEQRDLLRVLLKSDVYFVPFSFGDWSNVHTIGKVDLVKRLLDGNWRVGYYYSFLDDDVYYITIKFNEYRDIKDFLSTHTVKNDEDLDTFQTLEIYIPYCDFLSIYRNVFNNEKSKFWEDSLHKGDY